MKHKISGFSYWDTKPAVGEVGGSTMAWGISKENLKEVKSSNKFYSIPAYFYERKAGLIGRYMWKDDGYIYLAGLIQEGIPAFAAEHCPNLAELKGFKINKDQTTFDRKVLFDATKNKHLTINKVNVMFEQKVADPLRFKHLYFDVTQEQMDRWFSRDSVYQ